MHDAPLSRRAWLATLGRGLAASAALAALRPAEALAAEPPRAITVYKDPDCGCCREWVTHLKKNGFAPDARDRRDMDALKDSLGVPAPLRSCHTAVVGRYLVEGHVPAADITRLLAQAPKGVAGLAVPGMPVGAPGMETPGRRADRYDVIAFSATGTTSIFARHG